MALTTWAVYYILTHPPGLTTADASALIGVTGLNNVMVGFYQWSRARDDLHGH